MAVLASELGGSFPGDGEWLVGEFVKVEKVKRTIKSGDRSGESFTRSEVKLLLDHQYPRTIDYPEDRLPGSVNVAERGDRLALRVFARAGRDRVFFRGVLDEDGAGPEAA